MPASGSGSTRISRCKPKMWIRAECCAGPYGPRRTPCTRSSTAPRARPLAAECRPEAEPAAARAAASATIKAAMATAARAAAHHHHHLLHHRPHQRTKQPIDRAVSAEVLHQHQIAAGLIELRVENP